MLAVLLEELDGDMAGLLGDPVELVDEVHVPRRAAELAVRGRLEPDLLLLAHGVSDRRVLDGAKLRVVTRPAAWPSRAWRSAAGRRRLPTWSARNGGLVRRCVAAAVAASSCM